MNTKAICSDSIKKKKPVRVFKEKEFKHCDSLLTELLRSNYSVATKNMFIVFGIFYSIQIAADDFKTYNKYDKSSLVFVFFEQKIFSNFETKKKNKTEYRL